MSNPVAEPSKLVEETELESLEKILDFYFSQMNFFQTHYYLTLGRIEEIKSGIK